MKKLYGRKGTVHPTPPLVSDHLSFLPATILTLTVALSTEDREVLAYLLSCTSTNFSGNPKNNNSNNNNNRTVATVRTSSSGGGFGGKIVVVVDDHPPSFNCYCFRCYMSYWIRWDSSPNRQLIHEIIDAFEDSLLVQQNNKNKGKKERRKGKVSAKKSNAAQLMNSESASTSGRNEVNISDSNSVEENGVSGDVPGGGDGGGSEVCVDDKESSDKGSVRRFFSFLGEKIWGVST